MRAGGLMVGSPRWEEVSRSVPHALLLSGSLGQGHDVMAAACADSLSDRGWTTSTVDAMAMLGSRSGAANPAKKKQIANRAVLRVATPAPSALKP